MVSQQHTRKTIERRNFNRAGARELLFQIGKLLRCRVRFDEIESTCPIRFCCFLRVDVHNPQPGHSRDRRRGCSDLNTENVFQIRRGVGAYQKDSLSSFCEGNSRCARQRGLAYPTFAGEKEISSRTFEHLHGKHLFDRFFVQTAGLTARTNADTSLPPEL